MKGYLAFNLRPRSWRFGLEVTTENNDTQWVWFVFGPIAFNLGRRK